MNEHGGRKKKKGYRLNLMKTIFGGPRGKIAVPLELQRPHQTADLGSLPPKQVPMDAKITDTNTELKASSLPSLTVPSCVTCLCNCCDKGSRRKGEFTLTHSLRAQATVAGRAWWPACEAAGHIASLVRKQGQINAGAQPTFSVWEASPRNRAAHI